MLQGIAVQRRDDADTHHCFWSALSAAENGKIRLVYLGSDSLFGFFIQSENGVLTMGPLCVAAGWSWWR